MPTAAPVVKRKRNLVTESEALETIVAKLDTLIALDGRHWPEFASVQTAAKFTDLSPASIRRLLAAGKLTAHRPLKGSVRISIDELRELVTTATAVSRTGRGRQK